MADIADQPVPGTIGPVTAGRLTNGSSYPEPVSRTPVIAETCTATYTVSQADMDAGSINDTATATRPLGLGRRSRRTSHSAAVTATQSPAITITKCQEPRRAHGHRSTGPPTLSYTFLVSNEGNVTLHNVGVADTLTNPAPRAIGAVTCTGGTNGSVTLTPLGTSGDAITCQATFTVNQAGIDAGTVTDTATASGTSELGTAVTGTDIATVTATQRPAISVVKSPKTATVADSGDTVAYTFDITNTGNVTLHSVGVADVLDIPALGTISSVTCTGGTNDDLTLAPTDSSSCQATFTVNQAGIDAGTITDTATVSGTSDRHDGHRVRPRRSRPPRAPRSTSPRAPLRPR